VAWVDEVEAAIGEAEDFRPGDCGEKGLRALEELGR